MASIPPKKIQSIFDQLKRWPVTMPNIIIQKMMVTVAMTGETPILRIFLKEKSSPKEKRRNITPMSAHTWIFAWSTTDMV